MAKAELYQFPEGQPKLRPCYVQRLGKYTSFCGHSHKIRIPAPSRQRVKMYVVGDAGACRLPEIESHIDPAGMINLAKSTL